MSTEPSSSSTSSREEWLRAAQRRKHDPLLSCLIEIARFHNRGLTPEAFVSGLPLEDGCLTPSLFRRAATRAGLASRISNRSLERIHGELLPVILLLENDDACVLLGWNEERTHARVLFSEAGQGEALVALEQLEARYAGFCVFVRPRFRFDARAPQVGKVVVRHWFWGALAENWPVYRDVLLAAALVNLAAIATPLFSLNVYDRVVPNKAEETLWTLAVGLLVILVGDFSLRMLRGYFIDVASKRIDVSLSSLIMERVLGMRMEFRPSSVGSFAANLRAFESVRDFITSATVTALIDVPFTLIFFIVIIWLGWPMVFPPLIGFFLILAYAFVVQVKMQDLSEKTYRATAMRNGTLIESLVALETVKAQGAEGVMQRRWEQNVAYLARIGADLRLLSASVVNGVQSVQQVVYVAMIIVGVYMVGNAQLTLGGLIACSMLGSRALAPLGQVASLLVQYQNAVMSLKSLDQVMEQPVERPPEASFVRREAFKGDIEFENVSFVYPGREDEVLKNVSFKIKAGEHVAFIGRIGSGKSTIARLVLGLYHPTGGKIRVDGVDIRQLDPAELRRAIGYVPQDIDLFYGTIRENIVLGLPQVEDGAVLSAVEAAGLSELVGGHPRGLDMPIGERGGSLSGGQRQAVAIARAVLHEPKMLLLDEPTSAMDFQTEDVIKRNIIEFARHRTLLLVTHRNSLLDLAERMIVIDAGKVVADGPKEKVIEDLAQGRVRRA